MQQQPNNSSGKQLPPFQRKQLLTPKKPAVPMFDGTPPKTPPDVRGIAHASSVVQQQHQQHQQQQRQATASTQPVSPLSLSQTGRASSAAGAMTTASAQQQQHQQLQKTVSAPRSLFPTDQPCFSLTQPAQRSMSMGATQSTGASKNFAQRSGPPPVVQSAISRRPQAMSRKESLVMKLAQYAKLYPQLVANPDLILKLKKEDLQAIAAGQGGKFSKYTRDDLLIMLHPLAQDGQLKPPTKAAGMGSEMAAAGDPLTECKTNSLSSSAPYASRISFTQHEDSGDEEQEDEEVERSSAAKRFKASHGATGPASASSAAAARKSPPGTASSKLPLGAAPAAPPSGRSIDLASRSVAQPPWAAEPLMTPPGAKYVRPSCALSSFMLEKDARVVVLVPEYLRFRLTHQFALDRLARFQSRDVNPRQAGRPTLLQLGQPTGLVRAKVVALVPIIAADFFGANEALNAPPPTPWCVLILQQELAAGATEGHVFTLFYLDANWAPSDQPPYAREQLRVFNTAPFLLDQPFFEERMQHSASGGWKVGDLCEMPLLSSGEHDGVSAADDHYGDSAAAAASTTQPERWKEINRVGRIVAIRPQPTALTEASYLERAPFQSLHVIWLTPMEDGSALVYDSVSFNFFCVHTSSCHVCCLIAELFFVIVLFCTGLLFSGTKTSAPSVRGKSFQRHLACHWPPACRIHCNKPGCRRHAGATPWRKPSPTRWKNFTK